ncbi:MAG: hypothetical protein HOH42_16125 [Ilumatobacter sp.]|uniref:DUF5522 domain-containing protein n=1 Tax=Ilumatobacter sp. TaxID=1967498 RepID=UPI00375366CB|nr:hypothetical protein [Ilumatobacter sp.]
MCSDSTGTTPQRRENWRRHPDPRRLAPAHPNATEIIARHDAALDCGVPTYVDPISGFSVFTSDFLASRNFCCSSGCRHCPYA